MLPKRRFLDDMTNRWESVFSNDFSSDFSNDFMLPKRRFWKEEQKMTSGFSKRFSMVRSPNLVLTPLKSASKIRMSSFVPIVANKKVAFSALGRNE